MPLETVSYERRTLAGVTSTTYTDVVVFFSAIGGDVVPIGSSGATAGSDTCRAHIEAITLAVRPRKGDRLVRLTEGTWEIESTGVATLATRYPCNVRKVAS